LKTYIFRPFSGYGEDQDLDYPFPSFIRRAKEKQNPFDVWGDGLQVRDWIHIEDIVNAVMKVVEDDIDIGAINLGNAEPTNFIDLANKVCKLSGYEPTIKIHPDMPSGVGFRCSSNHKMLGFYKPKISLEEGIKRAL
jgi:nucleoside-diphosphate-sugar epimerase